jgi:hypothetical protein
MSLSNPSCLPLQVLSHSLGVLPVEVEPVEVVVGDELHDVCDEACARCRAVGQAAVLVAGRVVPPADGQQHLDAAGLERRHLLVELCKRANTPRYEGVMTGKKFARKIAWKFLGEAM